MLLLIAAPALARVRILDEEIRELVARVELLAAKESAAARADTLLRAAELVDRALPDQAAALRRTAAAIQQDGAIDPLLDARKPLEAAVADGRRDEIEAAAERFLTAVEHSAESPEDYAWFASLRRKFDIVKGGDNASVRAREALLDLRELVRTDFAFDLTAVDGGPARLATEKGTVTIVSFWATWCAPCLAELPVFERLWSRHHGAGLRIAAITGEPAETVRRFLRANPVSFPVLLDTTRAAFTRYGVDALPDVLVVDDIGRVRARAPGVNEPGLVGTIEKLLGGEP